MRFALPFFAALLLAPSLPAQAPDVTVTKTATHVDFRVTHATGAGIYEVDWSTLKVWINAFDATSALINLIGTPFATASVNPLGTELTVLLFLDLRSLAVAMEVCLLPGAGSGCGSSIGELRNGAAYPTASYTDNGWAMPVATTGWSSYSLAAFPFSSPATKVITQFNGVGSNFTSSAPSWATVTWYVNIWNSQSAMEANKTRGNVVSRMALSESHSSYGQANNHNYYVLLTPSRDIVLPPGPDYWIDLKAYSIVGTAWGWRESSAPGYPSDREANQVQAGSKLFNPERGFPYGVSGTGMKGY